MRRPSAEVDGGLEEQERGREGVKRAQPRQSLVRDVGEAAEDRDGKAVLCDGGQREQVDGVVEESFPRLRDDHEPGEQECGRGSEEAEVPDGVFADAEGPGSASRERDGEHQAERHDRTEGGDGDGAELGKVRMHALL